MLCAQCLLFDISADAVTTVNGISVCKQHAEMMLRGMPIHPPTRTKPEREAVAPEPTNDNPPLADPDAPPG